MPQSEVIGDVKANGSPPNTALAEAPDGLVNAAPASELHDLLHALQAMRVGDFSVRMAGRPGRPARQDRRHLQRDRRRQPAHGAAARARRPGGRPRRQDPAAREVRPLARRLGRDGDLGQHADRRSAVADHRGHPRHRAPWRRATCLQTVRLDVDGRPLQGRVPALGHHRQHDDQAAQRVHLGGDARRARGRHRRQARRPGAGARGDRRLEGPDRERQLDGVEPDRARCATSPR